MLVLRHPSDTITAEFNRQRDLERELDLLWDYDLGLIKCHPTEYWKVRTRVDELRLRPHFPTPEWSKREVMYQPPSSDIVCHVELPDSEDWLFDEPIDLD